LFYLGLIENQTENTLRITNSIKDLLNKISI